MTEHSIFQDFVHGRIDYDEMQHRLERLACSDRRWDLSLAWLIILSSLVIFIGLATGMTR